MYLHDPRSDEPGVSPAGSSAAADQPGAPAVDHRRLGRDLGIFTSDELVGAGFPLWLPDGAAIVAELERYVVEAERRAGYRHVRTPPVAKRELYERSGHWQHFGPDMFPPMRLGHADPAEDSAENGAEDDAAPRRPGQDNRPGDELLLRPVLCPHHALVFRSRLRSHRELPLRIGEFGPQFRMERSGVVGGLTRVRGMILNDAHIFCPLDQAADEVVGVLRMIDEAYDVLGISAAYHSLSLRGPAEAGKSYAGSEEMWQQAEVVLRQALERHGVAYREQPGEAAFYGPKIDIQVYDAQGREFTLSTVQVDLFQPERFDLEYAAPDGTRRRPVMVHRSVLASMERMVAYLLEAYAGALPPWLAPLQVLVLPVAEEQAGAAWAVARRLEGAGLRVEVDDRDESLGARIRAARLRKVPYVGVVGAREAAADSVTVRLRDGQQVGPIRAERFVDGVRVNVEQRRRDSALDV
ncbi:threonine--tRNA ligase [Actinopolymorpha alba]|uniref:threonine--tRNA ligase n=1 Tax=Actinopolymorpha alba TaxID=533267 RepID=UPI0003683162|nr:threonine--tRNA ligase [Actinopolymorpha alba]